MPNGIDNLSLMIRKKFGRSGEEGPKMQFLMEINDDIHRDFIGGANEVEVFENKEYIRLQKSTTRKALWFAKALKQVLNGEFKARKHTVRSVSSDFFDSVYVKGLGFVAIVFSVIQLGMAISEWLTKP